MTSAIALTFHSLQPETVINGADQDTARQRYLVPVYLLEKTVRCISPNVCCTVSDFIGKSEGHWLILTFDDGFVSDYEAAFPLLKKNGLKGTFFITAQNIGSPEYTNVSQLREMAKAGMEIGSHGLTHRYLVTMSRSEAIREIGESKDRLEQKLGIEITSFAPVGGHYRGWMVETALRYGYLAFASMIPGRTQGGNNTYLIKRNHIQAHHDEMHISRLLGGDFITLLTNRLRYHIFNIPKLILGMYNYDRVKGYILRQRTTI
jgi:peptidoglycan/xylan/chitin deacetylase (PgdA/CDA1 family)